MPGNFRPYILRNVKANSKNVSILTGNYAAGGNIFDITCDNRGQILISGVFGYFSRYVMEYGTMKLEGNYNTGLGRAINGIGRCYGDDKRIYTITNYTQLGNIFYVLNEIDYSTMKNVQQLYSIAGIAKILNSVIGVNDKIYLARGDSANVDVYDRNKKSIETISVPQAYDGIDFNGKQLMGGYNAGVGPVHYIDLIDLKGNLVETLTLGAALPSGGVARSGIAQDNYYCYYLIEQQT